MLFKLEQTRFRNSTGAIKDLPDTIEINSIEELMALIEKYNSGLVIGVASWRDAPKEYIEIYNDYRE